MFLIPHQYAHFYQCVLLQWISFPDIGEFMSILFWAERDRSTHMLVLRRPSADLKKELTLRREKIQLVWFLARQSTSHDQNGQVSGDLWRWEDSWWFTAPEMRPKSENKTLSFYWCKSFDSVAWQHTTKSCQSFRHSIVAVLLPQMIKLVVLWWEWWWRPSRRQCLSQFLPVIKD